MEDDRSDNRRVGGTVPVRDRRPWHWLLMLLACLGIAGVSASLSGASLQNGGVEFQVPETNPFPDLDEMDPQLAHRQLRALNAERQKELVSDTAKLVKLAKALDRQTQATDGATLTEAQWKEVDRIQKLARSVREKMVQTFGDGPIFRPVLNPAIH
jgi:hypothetical protein